MTLPRTVLLGLVASLLFSLRSRTRRSTCVWMTGLPTSRSSTSGANRCVFARGDRVHLRRAPRRVSLHNGTNGHELDTTPACATNTDFYCPPALVSVMATVTGTASSSTSAFSLEIDNADALFKQLGSGTALDDLPGPVGAEGQAVIGAPAFYGHKIFFGIATVGTHTGPLYAF